MIEENVNIHGRFQFELKQVFPFSRRNRRYDAYNVDTYLFLPASLHTNEDTYPREIFYRNLKTYIRLRTPTYSLTELAENLDPVQRLQESMHLLSREVANPRFQANYDYQLKLFCLIMKRSLRLAVAELAAGGGADEQRVALFCRRVKTITAAFRELDGRYEGFDRQGSSGQLFRLADEFISCRVELYSCKLLAGESGVQLSAGAAGRLSALIEAETGYRRKRGYPSQAEVGTNNESFLYRQAMLKKTVSNVLYLETRKQQAGILVRHILLGVAAGMAMLFATGVAFYWQNKYGALSFPLFLALVLGYILKDRMKDFLQVYFSRTLRHLFWDRKRTVFHSGGRRIGRLREHMGFVEQKALPPAIRTIRQASRPSASYGAFDEEVLCYRKQVRLASRRFRRVAKRYVTEGMLDITRLNIERFLHSMDAPRKTVYLLAQGACRPEKGDRVYHINMVQHYYNDEEESFRHFRIVLNRRGIKRIEPVAGPTA
ncbi:MAG: hypothetical protein ABFR97_09895 [Thermodesulfobacteriota bacterium]